MKRRKDIEYEEARLNQLGLALRTHRYASGFSQEALADAAGINRTHIGEVERGKRNVSFLNLCRMADALGVSLSELLKTAKL